MKNSTIALIAAAATLGLASAASAGTVYDNPYVFGNGGDCSFSTTCAAVVGRGDDYAAQAFTLTSAAVVTGASFTELDMGTLPTDANWGFALADGSGGLPGTFLSAGTDSITSSSHLGSDFGLSVDKEFFGVGPQALGPGTYYFIVQAVTSNFYNYLGFGAAASGAAETMDGGATWTPTYEGGNSVAVALYGTVATVPEPSTWAMMIIGFAGVGYALRRRAKLMAGAA